MSDKNDKKRSLSLNSTVSDIETIVINSSTKKQKEKTTKK